MLVVLVFHSLKNDDRAALAECSSRQRMGDFRRSAGCCGHESLGVVARGAQQDRAFLSAKQLQGRLLNCLEDGLFRIGRGDAPASLLNRVKPVGQRERGQRRRSRRHGHGVSLEHVDHAAP